MQYRDDEFCCSMSPRLSQRINIPSEKSKKTMILMVSGRSKAEVFTKQEEV